MNDILNKALTAQRAAEEQARAAQERAKKLAEFIEAQKQADALAAELNLTPDSVVDTSHFTPSSDQDVTAKRGSREIIREKAAEYIQQKGPLSVQQIVALLKRDGVDMRAKDPLAAVSQTLSLDGRFEPDRKRGWSLKSAQQKGESPAATGLSSATQSLTGLH